MPDMPTYRDIKELSGRIDRLHGTNTGRGAEKVA